MSISGFSLSSLKNTLDDVRASVYPRNETERKVYEALSSLKNYGASSTQMNDIASETFDYEKYKIITSVVFANLDTDGKPWKQIFKTLTLIEFLIKNGAERFIEECRDKLYKIRALQDFNFYEGTVDKGSGVREKAKQVVELLGSNEMIRTEREKARVLRNKLVGIDSRNGGGSFGGSGSYGGSSGNSYGGNGSDSRYDNGSGGNSYGGDSRYGDSGIGSGSGGSRYGDSGIGSNSNNSGGRYGGGAYDSNRPGRYNDEAPPADSFGGGSSNSRYSDEQTMDPEPQPVATTRSTPRKSTSSGVTGVSSTAGKLKVNIKKVGTPVTTSKAQPAAAEVDLIGGEIDLMGGGNDGPFGTSGGGGSSDFDPFQTAPAAAPAASAAAAAFDPFATNFAASSGFSTNPTPANYQPAALTAPAIDIFAAAPQPVMMSAALAAPAFNNNSFPTAGVQPQYGGYSAAPPAAPVGMMGGMISYGQPMQPQPVPMTMGGGGVMNAQQQYRAPQQGQQMQRKLSSQSNDADFGDFTGATSTSQGQQSKPAAAPTDPWGSLVNLSKIEKNDELANKQRQEAERNSAQQYSANSFVGLDGFSKAPQNSGGARPVNSYQQQQAPMGMAPVRPMMSNNPPLMNMGGGMNPNMMGGGMGMPAGGMAPMNYGSAPMGYGVPTAPGGYPPMGMGGMPAGGMGYPPAATGYPPNNAGGYGAPMGNMGYPPAGNMPPSYGMPPRGF